MPLYEYQCEACGSRFERIQKYSDPPIAACPSCGGSVRKLISSPAFQFKGTGWYVTDYARAGGGKSADTDAKDAPAGKAEGSETSEKAGKSGESQKSEKPDKTADKAKAPGSSAAAAKSSDPKSS